MLESETDLCSQSLLKYGVLFPLKNANKILIEVVLLLLSSNLTSLLKIARFHCLF